MEASPLQTTKHRFIPGLESLRGLAALCVCLTHVIPLRPAFPDGLSAHGWVVILLNGRGAVVLFFVLSGFVLRFSLTNQAGRSDSVVARSFLLGRFFRLFPVLVATVAVVALVNWICRHQSITLVDFLRNAFLVDVSFVGSFWTMQIEVFGSVLVLLAFLIERRTNLLVIVAMTAVMILTSFGGKSWVLGPIPVGCLYLFLFGYLLAGRPKANWIWGRYGQRLLLIGLVSYYGAAIAGNVFKSWLTLWAALGAIAIVGWTANTTRHGVLEWRPVRLLGLVSYDFYALHPLGIRTGLFLEHRFAPQAMPIGVVIVMRAVVVVALTLAFAVCMHFLVERPGMTLGRWSRRLLVRRATFLAEPELAGDAATG